MALVILPRLLAETVTSESRYEAHGSTLGDVLEDLFTTLPGLRNHIVDETGAIRPHVSLFVDGDQADLGRPVGEGSQIRVLHAVSGG
ncbi:MAG TPA: MoaD/ThiS family protein [Acidimicrobiia bacterium]|jgi:hypothetical protein|nr:MoaD/ThiS family protein [Acidimicrobiia bacterium]